MQKKVRLLGWLLVILAAGYGSKVTVLGMPEQCSDICTTESDAATECGIGYNITNCATYGVCDLGTACGNGTCDVAAGEDCSCATDCGQCIDPIPVCGNTVCETGEDYANCPQDCELFTGNDECGDHHCTGSETPAGCPQDCTATDLGCNESEGWYCPTGDFSCTNGQCMYTEGISALPPCHVASDCQIDEYCQSSGYFDIFTGEPVGVCSQLLM